MKHNIITLDSLNSALTALKSYADTAFTPTIPSDKFIVSFPSTADGGFVEVDGAIWRQITLSDGATLTIRPADGKGLDDGTATLYYNSPDGVFYNTDYHSVVGESDTKQTVMGVFRGEGTVNLLNNAKWRSAVTADSRYVVVRSSDSVVVRVKASEVYQWDVVVTAYWDGMIYVMDGVDLKPYENDSAYGTERKYTIKIPDSVDSLITFSTPMIIRLTADPADYTGSIGFNVVHSISESERGFASNRCMVSYNGVIGTSGGYTSFNSIYLISYGDRWILTTNPLE